jgi:hypothetical protein
VVVSSDERSIDSRSVLDGAAKAVTSERHFWILILARYLRNVLKDLVGEKVTLYIRQPWDYATQPSRTFPSLKKV